MIDFPFAQDPAFRPVASARVNSLEHWAATKPDQVAIVDGNATWTWRDFNAAADRFAAALASRGVRAGTVVAVRIQIRAEWMVINAAIGKLQGILLGVNWRLTPSELEFQLENSGAAVLICDDQVPALLRQTARTVGLRTLVSMDVPAEGFDFYPAMIEGAQSLPLYSAGDTPLIIYTSGTTGRPKGVLLGRRPTDPPPSGDSVEYAQSVSRSIPRSEKDIVLICMPLSHGSAPAHIRRQVQVGGRTVLARRYEPEHTLELIERYKITVWIAVPTMLNRMAALPEEQFVKHDISSLDAILVGAAPISPSVKEWASSVFGGNILHEGYGSTETGMITHLPPELSRFKPGSCGKPFAHVEISIRDDQGRELPTASDGEIWVKSPATIPAYFACPPLGPDTRDAQGFFLTGDVGHVDEDGFLYITGRSKDMIVSGGVNIYPAEIEAALHEHPAVQEVAVIGIPDSNFGEQVKAFIELKPGHKVQPGELLDMGRKSLATYKLPKTIEFVDELPRNLTGKVLKTELRARDGNGRDNGAVI